MLDEDSARDVARRAIDAVARLRCRLDAFPVIVEGRIRLERRLTDLDAALRYELAGREHALGRLLEELASITGTLV